MPIKVLKSVNYERRDRFSGQTSMRTLKKRSKRVLLANIIRRTSKNLLHPMMFPHDHGTHLQLTCSFGTMIHTFLFLIISATFHWFESLVIFILTLLLHILDQCLKNTVFQISRLLEMTLKFTASVF